MNSPIDPNSIRYLLGIASWQGILAWIFLFLAFAFMILYFKSKRQNKKRIFTVSFLLGFLIGIIFLLIFSLTKSSPNPFPDDPDFIWITWESEVINIFSLLTSIYFSLIIFIIPILIFSSLIVVINKNRHNSKIGPRAFITSAFSLLVMAIIGIFVALILFPLINLIVLPDTGVYPNLNNEISNSTIPGILNAMVPSSLSVFSSINLILSIVFIGIFVGFILKSLHKKNHIHGEKVIRFFEHLLIVIKKYISFISLLLPFVIISRIPIIFVGDFISNILNLGIFFGVFILGIFIITFIEAVISIFFMSKKPGQKQSNASLYFKVIKPYWVESLTKVNSSTLLPYTIDTSLKLNANRDVSNLTPTLGTTMGQSVCAAFYPTFITLMTANLTNVEITFQFLLILVIIVLITNIGVTGIPGADSTLNLIVLGTMGLPPTFYVNILLVEPILDPIRTLGNATGFVAATLISSRVLKKSIF